MIGRIQSLVICALVASLCAGCKAKKAPAVTRAKWEVDLEASMKAFENRKRYPALALDTIKGIPDAKLEQAVIDFIDCKFEKSKKPERQVLGELSTGFRAVYSTWILEGEVNNGGFNQFFWNSSGDYAAEAQAGFDLMGATAYAGLLRRATAIRDADRRKTQVFKDRGTIEAFSESYENNRLNDLDLEFYKLGDNLSAIRIKFIRAHPEMFVGVCG